MDPYPPLASASSSPASSAAPTATPPKPASARPRLFSALLILAAITSVLSTLGFLGYLFLPQLLGSQPRSHFVALYTLGLVGVVVAEACQVLGVFILLGHWFSRANVQKQARELLVLLASLIPYLVVVIFLITLFVYLRARSQDRFSTRTQAAAHALKEPAADTLIDAGSNSSSSAAGSPAIPTAASATTAAQPAVRPSMQDALRRVVGPATGKSVSEAASGLVGVTMVALLLSTVATAAAAVPAHGLAPIQAYLPTSGAPGAASPPASLTGKWSLTFPNFSETNCSGQKCVTSTPTAAERSGPPQEVSIQQSGNHVVMTIPGTPSAFSSTTDTFSGGDLSLAGTVSGSNVTFSYSYKGPVTSGGVTIDVNLSEQFAGSILSANQMRGTFTASLAVNRTALGQQFSQTGHETGDWTATRTTP